MAVAAFSGSPLLPWEVIAGAALLVSGALLRIFAVRHIGKRARVARSGAAFLLCEGPFGHVRNPLYVANLQTAAGACVLSGLQAWSVPVVAFVLATYHVVVRAEESRLRELFGPPYDEYKARVPRWIPRITAAEPLEVDRSPLWTWPTVLRREGPYLFGIVVILASLSYVRFPGPGIPALTAFVDQVAGFAHAPRWALLVLILVAISFFEGLATHMKRRRHELMREKLAAEGLLNPSPHSVQGGVNEQVDTGRRAS
jgi:hypothetical protein